VKQTIFTMIRNPMKAFFVGVIRFYQVVISPAMPGRCKYYPSCSQYALDAVREYGAARGLVLGAWRVLRCNPLSYGGYDPVSRQKLFRSRGVAAGDSEAVGCAAGAGAGAGAGSEAVASRATHGRHAAHSHRHAAHSHLVRG
jgi:putative membrane protein insertion efficiency factor